MRHVNASRLGRRRVAVSVAALAVGALFLLPSAASTQVPADAAKAVAQVQGAASSKAAPAIPAAAEAAAKASPDLVGALSKELGASPAQAAGAAGSLFGLAKSRLKAEEFGQISKAVPGMDSLLKAAPAAGGATGTSGAAGALSALGGSAAGLAGAASAFSKLGLKPEMVAKAIPVLTQFVSKGGGAGAANLLASVLK